MKGTYGVLFATPPKEKGVGAYKFGFTIPKKVGGAVERNLMKRRLSDIVAKWIKLHEDEKLPSFNAAYLAHKFAEDYGVLEKEVLIMCDNLVRMLK